MRCFKKGFWTNCPEAFFFGLQRLPNQPKHIVVGDLVDLAFGEALLLQALQQPEGLCLVESISKSPRMPSRSPPSAMHSMPPT